MSRIFTSSVAVGALIAMLGGPVLAQDAAQAPQDAPTIVVPQVLKDAGLTDVESKSTRRGNRIEGKLPDGTALDAILDEQGQLRGLRTEDKAALPAALIQQLVPQAVRDQAIFAELAQIEAVFTGERGVMIAGQDAQQKPVRAAFAQDGTLLRFGRGEDAGPEMGRDMGHGKPGHDKRGHDRGDHDKGPRGKHGHGDRDHDHKRGDDDHAKRGDGPRQQGTPPSPDQVRASLTEAGYTGIGQILQQGPVTVAQATNPEGEAVLVEIATNGEVLRELNR